MTRRCRRYIQDNCFKRTFADLAAQTGVSESTIRRIADELLVTLDKNFRIVPPRVLSIDEVYLPSGKDYPLMDEQSSAFPDRSTRAYRTVISDGETSQVVDVLEDRTRSTVVNFLLGLQGAHRVRYVTMDLSDTFRDAVYLAFGDQVTVIADRWHVTKHINAVVEKERSRLPEHAKAAGRSFRRALTAHGAEFEAKNPERFLLLNEFLQNVPKLAEVYHAKERLLQIYDSPSKSSARTRFEAWSRGLSPDLQRRFTTVTELFRRWEPEIFDYWDRGYQRTLIDREKHARLAKGRKANDPLLPMITQISRKERWVGVSNGRAEVRNQLVRMLNRVGRSYSFRFLRARAIYSTFDVSSHFGVCESCRLPFKRDVNSKRRSREIRSREFGQGRSLTQRFALASWCANCDPASSGVPKLGAIPVDRHVTRCGLADIWTDPEPRLADSPEYLHDVERRYRRLLRDSSKKFRNDLRSELDAFMDDLFITHDKRAQHCLTLGPATVQI